MYKRQALYGTGTTLNVMSLLGGIMLIVIVVKNGIVLIDYITLCRERGRSVIHSVVVSGRRRDVYKRQGWVSFYQGYSSLLCSCP